MVAEKRSLLLLNHLLFFLLFLLMPLISFLPSTPAHTPHSPHPPRKRTNNNNYSKNHNKAKKKTKLPTPPPPPTTKPPSSWENIKNLLNCKNITTAPSQIPKNSSKPTSYTRLGSTCGASICAIRDVVQGNARITDHGSSSESGSHNESTPLSVRSGRSSAPPPPSRGGMQLMKLSGCYECHAVDVHSASRRYPRPRTLSPCTECGEVFTKPESLEMHQAIRHAVSELGPEDSSRNIVEIIFKSSWQIKNTPQICTIERILKIHNTQRTISRFEDYRDSIKSRHIILPLPGPTANKPKNPRCAADGNELLRFHATSISCSLASNNSTALCLSSSNSAPPCNVCTIIRYGFARGGAQHERGVRTTASSGRAHEWGPPEGGRQAMLVCRVIAGRIRKHIGLENEGDMMYDSVAEDGGVEELFVANPRAILPCFVVIYKACT